MSFDQHEPFRNVSARPEPGARAARVPPPPRPTVADLVPSDSPVSDSSSAEVPGDRQQLPVAPLRLAPDVSGKPVRMTLSLSLPKSLSDSYTAAAKASGHSLSRFAIEAVRKHWRDITADAPDPREPLVIDPDDPLPPAPEVTRVYREPSGSVRRDLKVTPAEHAGLLSIAGRVGVSMSSLVRLSLERTLADDR